MAESHLGDQPRAVSHQQMSDDPLNHPATTPSEKDAAGSTPLRGDPDSTPGEARALARAQKAAEAFEQARSTLITALLRARKRLAQRVLAVGRDLTRIDESEAWTARAPWLVAAAAKAPRGARSLEVSDWSSGQEQVFSFPLDPSRTAREQVDAAFQKARRLRKGRPLAEQRQSEAKRAIEAIDQLTSDLRALSPASARIDEEKVALLEDIRARALAALPHDVRGILPGAVRPLPGNAGKSGKRGESAPGKLPPFRAFTARSGLRILVGRRAEQNDQLTFQVSRPHHLWLHAKDQTGAHVIAWNEKGKALTELELVDAAVLAAHFSDARGEPVVDVSYTPRRYVRKPRRAAAGLVIADRAKVISVRIDPAHLKALLETEVEG